MDTIKCMNTFVAVASQSSFTGGAKRLNITTKLASKYVQQLEEKLGAQLFNRTTRSVTLTDIGQAYFERCVPLLNQFDELEGLVQERQSELAGPIRITAPTAFGSKELVEAILPFQLKHPKVIIDLHLSDQRVAVVEGGFDLALRFGQLDDSSLIARRLINMKMVIVASPAYLDRHGYPQYLEDLSKHNCLLQTASVDPEHWKLNENGHVKAYKVSGTFHGNSPRAIAHMALGGLGIGMCPLYVVEQYIMDGSLTLLFEDKETPEFLLNAIYPPNRHLTARIRALIDHLVNTLDS